MVKGGRGTWPLTGDGLDADGDLQQPSSDLLHKSTSLMGLHKVADARAWFSAGHVWYSGSA